MALKKIEIKKYVLREAFTKKIWSNLGKSPNREGGRSSPLNPIPNLLTVFSKIAQNAQKHIINTEPSFHLQGVGLTPRKICLASFLHLVYRENIRTNVKLF